MVTSLELDLWHSCEIKSLTLHSSGSNDQDIVYKPAESSNCAFNIDIDLDIRNKINNVKSKVGKR